MKEKNGIYKGKVWTLRKLNDPQGEILALDYDGEPITAFIDDDPTIEDIEGAIEFHLGGY